MNGGKSKPGRHQRLTLHGMLCVLYRGAHCERKTVHLPRSIPEKFKRSLLEETKDLEMISDVLDLGWEPIYAEDAEGEIMWFKKRIHLGNRR